MHRALCTLASLLAVMCFVASVVDAAPGFSEKDVDGPTAFDFDGWVTVDVGGTATMVPAAASGRFVADGKGNITEGVRTLVAGGMVLPPQTFTCGYSVNPDGTGNASCTVTTAGVTSTETFSFVIVERKKEAFFTSTTAGSTLRGRTKRQH